MTEEIAEEKKDEIVNKDVELIISTTSKGWLSVVKPLTALVDEVKMQMGANGIRMTAVDPAHVAMMDYTIPSSFFTEFIVPKKRYEIGVDLEWLIEHFSTPMMSYKNGIIRAFVNPEKKYVRFEAMARGVKVKRHGALVDPAGMGEPKIPKLNLPWNLRLSEASIMRMVLAETGKKQIGSDHVAFVARKEGDIPLSIECTHFEDFQNNHDAYQFTSDIITLDTLNDKEHDKLRSLYPQDYLLQLSKAMCEAFSPKIPVTYSLGNDYPIMMSAEASGKKMMILLAPRIESE